MPSKNRIAAYPPDHIHEKLGDFAKEHQLSESKALIQILAEYFGVASNVAQEVSYRYATVEQIEAVEKKIVDLSKLFNELQSKLLSSPTTEFASSEDKLNNELQGELLIDSAPSKDDGDNGLGPFTVQELVERFPNIKVNQSISNAKNRYKGDPEGFVTWSRKKDKDGIGWRYDSGKKLYYPADVAVSTTSTTFTASTAATASTASGD